MKTKYLLLAILLLLVVGLYAPASYSAYPDYDFYLNNDIQTAPNVYEFDVYLHNRNGTPDFHYYGSQAKLGITVSALNGGTLTPTWVPGSIDAGIVAAGQVNPLSIGAGQAYISILLPSSATFSTCAIISGTYYMGSKLGRLRLTNTVTFAALQMNVTWLDTDPSRTQVWAYNSDGSGLYSEITNSKRDGFSTFGNAPLPVELSSFVSASQGRTVVLNWSTKTEKNSNIFNVERKITGANWETIGSVKAAVLSNSPKQYSYADNKLQTGKYQYRLNMIDNDGSFQYSKIVETEIALPNEFELSQNYPNPFNPSTKINYTLPFDSKVTLEVYNIAGVKIGQLVNSEQSAGYYTIDFNSSAINGNISSGVYFYRITAINNFTGKNFSSIKKMIMLK